MYGSQGTRLCQSELVWFMSIPTVVRSGLQIPEHGVCLKYFFKDFSKCHICVLIIAVAVICDFYTVDIFSVLSEHDY